MSIQRMMRLSVFLMLIGFASVCATNTMSKTEKTEAYNQYIVSEKLEELKSIAVFRMQLIMTIRLLKSLEENQRHLLVQNTEMQLDNFIAI